MSAEEELPPKEVEMSTEGDPAIEDTSLSQYSSLVEVLGHEVVAEIPETSRQAISEKLASLLSSSSNQDSTKVAQLQSDNEDLRSALDDTRYELSNAQERLSAVNAERDEVIRLKEHLVSEVKSLGEKFSKREEEYKRVVSDREDAVSKLASVEASACNLKILEEDLKSREEEISKKESRISEEKELMNIHVTSLSSELQETRSEFSKAKTDWQNENTKLQNELRSTTDSLSVCEAKLEVSEHEVKTVTEQLNTAKEIIIEKDATIGAYINEIQAQKNLTQMHQDKNEHLSARLVDMERSITEYQELLLREQKRYIDLENLYDRDVSDQREELTKAHSTNQSLEKGLKEATSMVEDMRRKGLSDEVLAQLSPAAAAASKLLKPHMGLTEIYSELVTYKEKFFECESQKRNLEIQLSEVLSYVGGKTAGFKKLRQDLEHTLNLLDETKADLDKEKEEHNKTQDDLKRLQRSYIESQNMNEAQESKAVILGQQIRSLLSGKVSDTDGYDFQNYADLQQLNERLVGEISTLKQKLSQIKHEDELVKLHYENESLMTQNCALSQEVNTLKAVCETLADKAKCFKSESEHLARRMTELENSIDSSHVSNVVTPSDKRLEDAQQELQELKEEFVKYKEERQRNESILISQFEKTKETLLKARLSSVSIAQGLDSSAVLKMDFLKQEVRSFERTNGSLQTIIKSQEEALQSLHDYIIATESKLSTTTLKLSNSELELKRLQITAEKLSKMNEVLQNKRILETKIELCHAQLEGAEMINRIQLENKVTTLQKENQDLKASIESHLENHKNEKSQWNDATLELKAELQKVVDSETKAKENLSSVQSELETVKDQLEMVRGSINPSQEVTGAKVTELQQQIRGLRNDVVSLQKQLTASRDELAKQKVAADNQEKIFASAASSAQEKESKLEMTISELHEQCATLKKNNLDLITERDGLQNQLKEHDVLDGLKAKEKLKIVQADLDLALTKVSSFNLTILKLKNETAQITAKLENSQASYQMELVKKGEALKSVVDLRKKLQTMIQENTNLSGLLERTQKALKEKEALVASLENRFDNLNSSLGEHNESANLSNVGDTSLGDSNLLKGLQGDNNILASQLSVAKAHNQILQVEVEQLKKELDRVHQSTRDAISNAPDRKMEPSKFKDIFDKAALVPGLSEVNLTLRAANERLLAENQTFVEKIQNAEEVAQKLQLMTTKFEETCQALKQVEIENKDLKLKVQQHTDNARALKFDNLTKLKTEKEDLIKQLASIQAAVRAQKSEMIGLTSKLNIGETKLKEKDSELQTMRISHNQIQIKLNNALKKCTEIEAAQKQAQLEKETASTSDKSVITEKNARIEFLVNQLNSLKSFGKQLRTKLEASEQEKTDLNAKIKKLEESGLKKEPQEDSEVKPEALELLEQSSQRINYLEAELEKLKNKYEKSQEQITRSKKVLENYKESCKARENKLQEENETLKRKLGENVTPVGSSRSSPARSEWLSPSTSSGVPTGGLSPATKRPLSQDTDSAKRTRLETIDDSPSEQPRAVPVPSVVVSEASSVESRRAAAPEFDDVDLAIGHREMNTPAHLDRADNRTAVVPELIPSLSSDRFSSRDFDMTGQYGSGEDTGDDRTVPGTPSYTSDGPRAVPPFPEQSFSFTSFPPSSFVGGHFSQEQLSQGGLENTSIDIMQLTNQPPPPLGTQNIPVIERRRIEPPPNPRPGYMGELGESSRPLYHDNFESGSRAAMSMPPNMRGAPRGPRVNRNSLLWTQQQVSGPPGFPPHRTLRPRGFSPSLRNRGPPPS